MKLTLPQALMTDRGTVFISDKCLGNVQRVNCVDVTVYTADLVRNGWRTWIAWYPEGETSEAGRGH